MVSIHDFQISDTQIPEHWSLWSKRTNYSCLKMCSDQILFKSINFIMFSFLFDRKTPFGSTERKTPVKKLAPEFSKVKTKTPKHSPIKEEPCGSLSETVCKRDLRSQETPEKPRSSVDTPPRLSTPQKGPSAHPKEKAFSSEIEDLPYLSTTEMYLCRWHQPPPSPLPLRESSPKKEETVASKA